MGLALLHCARHLEIKQSLCPVLMLATLLFKPNYMGGITSFSVMINNAVHVIMYSYYLLSSEGSPRVKTLLIKYKKWLTIMQMIQFTLMLIYSAQVFLPSCPAPLGITIIYFPNVIFVYYMFYNFFKRNYSNVKQNGCSINGTQTKTKHI